MRRWDQKRPDRRFLTQGEEAIVIAFRKHTLLPLDDCLYALPATIPHLTRSALHRCLQRHGISRLPEIEGEKPSKKKFKTYPIGFVHIDIAEVRTEQGKLFLFIAIDRTSKLAFARLAEKANTATAVAFVSKALSPPTVIRCAPGEWRTIIAAAVSRSTEPDTCRSSASTTKPLRFSVMTLIGHLSSELLPSPSAP